MMLDILVRNVALCGTEDLCDLGIAKLLGAAIVPESPKQTADPAVAGIVATAGDC